MSKLKDPIEKQKESNRIMTGSHDLNKWFSGGYEKEIITLFYGPSASGKTNFVILAACHIAKKNKKVIFIDTEGGLSLDRIKQISGGLPEFILKNILILKPINFEEQKKAFIRLLKELKNQKNNIGLIVVDSMTMLYRLELAESRKKGLEAIRETNSDLAKQMKTLYEIARQNNLPILITSQVYSEFLNEKDWVAGKEAKMNIVGGDLLKYWSKTIIELKLKNNKRKAIIQKSRSSPQKELNFEIVNEGIRRRRWI